MAQLWQSGLWQSGLWQSEEGEGLETCIASITIIDAQGAPIEGARGVAIVERLPQSVDGSFVAVDVDTATSNSSGLLTFPPLLQGAVVTFRIDAVGYLRSVTIPDAATLTLS